MIKELRYACGEYLGAASDRYADAIWLSGREKRTGQPLTSFYFGSGRSFDHLVDKLYDGYVTFERCEEGCTVLRARHWLGAAERDPAVDLVLADIPWPYHHLLPASEYVHVPGWIVQKLPLPPSWDGVLGKFRKNTKSTDLRKIRKHKLSFRMTQDRATVESFYDAMYLPYTERRFTGLAVIDDRDEVVELGVRGGLLQVMQEDRVLAAVVLMKWGQTMHFLWFGLPEGLEEALLDAALSGLYYFTIQHAHEQGCTEVNFSYTVPLLNDGIYRYKRKWGAGVHAWPFGRILMRPRRFSAPIASFFANQPVVAHTAAGLVGKVVVEEAELTPEAVKEIADRFMSEGLASMQVFSMAPVPESVRQADSGAQGRVEVCDLSAAVDPVGAFCRWK